MTSKAESIVFFLPTLDGGGAERLFVDLANWCASQGFDVTMVCGRAEGECRDGISEHVGIVDLGVDRVLGAIPKLRRYVSEHEPAVVFSSMTHANIAATIALRFFGRMPCRVALHEVAKLDLLAAGKSVMGTLLYWALPLVFPKADAVVSIAGTIARDLEGYVPSLKSKMYVVPAPLDLKRIGPMSQAPADHPWLRDPNTPVVLGVGRFVPEKDTENLLRAFAIVQKTHPKAKLLLLGDGVLRGDLEQLAQKLDIASNIDMPGFSANPYPAFKAADVFALPSKSEGFPVVLGEALSMGCNVVATNCSSGVEEVLDGGRFGTIVPVGDPQALAQAIIGRLDKPLERNDLIQRGACFDIDVVGQQILGILFGQKVGSNA